MLICHIFLKRVKLLKGEVKLLFNFLASDFVSKPSYHTYLAIKAVTGG